MISLNLRSLQAAARIGPEVCEPGELDWRGAYQRMLAQQRLPPGESQHLPVAGPWPALASHAPSGMPAASVFVPASTGASSPRTPAPREPSGRSPIANAVQDPGDNRSSLGLEESSLEPGEPVRPDEAVRPSPLPLPLPGWGSSQHAAVAPVAQTQPMHALRTPGVDKPLRVLQEAQEPPPAPWQPAPLPLVSQPPGESAAAPASPQAPTVTLQRMQALLTEAPVAPTRVWEVELPSVQPGWQLRIEQPQPLAPLRLDLSAPAVLQPQARRQLAELDKRLREAGHEVLGARLSDSPRLRSQRVDEVQP